MMRGRLSVMREFLYFPSVYVSDTEIFLDRCGL